MAPDGGSSQPLRLPEPGAFTGRSGGMKVGGAFADASAARGALRSKPSVSWFPQGSLAQPVWTGHPQTVKIGRLLSVKVREFS